MKNSVIILLVITILSCSREKKNEILLFNEIKFKINEGEAIGIVNSKIKNIYTENFNNSQIQVPLFKYIKHNNYEIFIGIPYNTSIEALVQNQLEKHDSIITNIKSDTLSYYIKYKRNGLYITEYAANVASNSLIYISTMSISKELTDSLFNKLDFSSRINTNNK
jgi:hypothetical protein